MKIFHFLNMCTAIFFLLLYPTDTLAIFDQDQDGISDARDNCPVTFNLPQSEIDGNAVGDLCDENSNTYHKNDKKFGLIGSQQDRVSKIPIYQRPRLLTTKKQIDALKILIKQDPYRTFWEDIRRKANRYSTTNPPCTVQAPDCDSKKRITEYGESSIRALGNQLPYLTIAWLLTGKEKYLFGARSWMNAFAAYKNWATNKDIGSAHLLLGMSLTYDWLYEQFTEVEKQNYRNKMRHQANILSELFREKYMWWSRAYLQNHNYTIATALAFTATALYGEVDEADDWLNTADTNYQSVINLLSPDGASHEGVGYWGTGMQHLLEYFLAIQRFDVRVNQQFVNSSYFKNAALYRLHASLPGFVEHVDYSDNRRVDYEGPGHLLRALASKFSNGHAQWLAEKIESARGDKARYHWLDLIWHDASITPIPPNNLKPFYYFENMGILFSRTDWSDTAFWSFYKSGPPQGFHAESLGHYAGSHIHPDEGEFLTWSNGNWLVIDDGYVVPKHTENHNVLLFNNAGQLGSDSKWFNSKEVKKHNGTVLPVYSSITDLGQYIITEMAPIYRKGAHIQSWQRSFVFLPEGFQIIRDDVLLNAPGQVKALMHTQDYAYFPKGHSRELILNPIESALDARDLSGTTNNGKITNGQISEGIAGRGIAFVGKKTKIEFPSLNGINFPSNGSLSLWINLADFTRAFNKDIFDKYDKKRDHMFIRTYGVGSQKKPGIQIAFQKSGSSNYSFSKNISLPTKEWHHIVVTWDTMHDAGTIYLNGTKIFDAPITDSDWTPNSQVAIFGKGFTGMIDEVQLFNRVINSSEAWTLHNRKTISRGLIGFWRFDVTDSVKSQNFTEYSYKLVYPNDAQMTVSKFSIPPVEQHSTAGNYSGVLATTLLKNEVRGETVHLIHVVGNKDVMTRFDESENKIIINYADYDIIVDFEARRVSHEKQ